MIRKQGDYILTDQLTPQQIEQFKQHCYACGARKGYFLTNGMEGPYLKWDNMGQLDVYTSVMRGDGNNVTHEYLENPHEDYIHKKLVVKDGEHGQYLEKWGGNNRTYTLSADRAINFLNLNTQKLLDAMQDSPYHVAVMIEQTETKLF